jgi:hypothetical protein
MTLFLDSTFVEDARRAADLGFVVGLTTNPTLIGKALKAESQPPIGRIKSREDLIAAICDVFPGMVKDAAGNELFTSRDNVRYNAGQVEDFLIRLGEKPAAPKKAKTRKS